MRREIQRQRYFRKERESETNEEKKNSRMAASKWRIMIFFFSEFFNTNLNPVEPNTHLFSIAVSAIFMIKFINYTL